MPGTQADAVDKTAVAFEALGKLAAMPEMPAATKAALAEVEVQVAAALAKIADQRATIKARDYGIRILRIEAEELEAQLAAAREALFVLGRMGLCSQRYQDDPEYRDAVDAALAEMEGEHD